MLRAAVGLFLYQLGIVLVIVAAIAAIWALGYGGPFAHAYGTACLVFGCLALLFGALGLGGMSPSLGLVETAGRGGTNPLAGMPAYFRTSPGTTAVNSTAIFFLTSLGSPAPAAAPDLRGHGSQASAKEANRLELVMATAKP